MRYIVLPIVYGGVTDVKQVSIVMAYMNLCKGILENEPDSYFYILFPEYDGWDLEIDVQYFVDYLQGHAAVHRYKVDGKFSRWNFGYLEHALSYSLFRMLAEVWNKENLYADVILTADMVKTSAMYLAYMNKYTRTVVDKVSLVKWDSDTYTVEKIRKLNFKPYFPSMDYIMQVELLDSVGNIVQYSSIDEMRMQLKEVRKILSPTMFLKFKDNAFVSPLFPMLEAGEPRKGTNMFYGGSVTSKKKRFDNVMDVWGYLQTKIDGDFIVSTQDEELEIDSLERVFVNTDVDSEKYHKLMSDGDFFLCCSESDTTGRANLEQLYFGMPGVFMKYDWLDGILPDDYPWMVESVEEMKAVALEMVKNIEVAKQYVTETLRPWLDEHYGTTAAAKRWLKNVRSRMKEPLNTSNNMYTKLLKSNDLTGLTLLGVAEKVTEVSDAHIDIRRLDKCSPRFLRRVVLNLGYKDTCETYEPKFVKEN